MKHVLSILLLALLSLPVVGQAPPDPAVPEPDLSALEAPVAAQLREAREELLTLAGQQPPPAEAELGEAWGELGRLYHAYSLAKPAEAAYREAVRLAPGDFGSTYLLANLLQGEGRLEEAEPLYRRALEIEPGRVPALIHLGEVLLAQGKAGEAEAALKEALAGDPRSAAARAALGQVALSRQDYQAAADHLEAALAAAPEATRLHHPLGLAYRGLGELEKAVEHLAQRGEVGIRPPDPLIDGLQELKQGERVFQVRGRVAFRAGRYAEAAEAFRKAVAANPQSAAARVNLAAALVGLEDREGAVRELREALRLDPGSATAHFNLGVLLSEAGGFAEAAGHLAEAVRLAPRDGQAHAALARALERTGEPGRAAEHWALAAQLSPADEQVWLDGAALLIRGARYKEARERLDAAYTALPESGRIALALARLLALAPDPGLRDGARALRLAQQVFAAQATPENATLVAAALAELGRCDEAANWQRQAVEALRKAGATAGIPAMEQALTRYQKGTPCRDLPAPPR